MAPGCVNILMHYGGAFAQEDPLTYYDGGEVQLFRNIDKDVMSYFHVAELAKSVGFKDGDNLFYAIPGCSLEASIDLLKDDASVYEMMKFSDQTNFLEVYIQHKEHDTGGNSTVGNTVHHTDALFQIIFKQCLIECLIEDSNFSCCHAFLVQKMARPAPMRPILLFIQQFRHHRLKIVLALHVAFLYWVLLIRKKRLRLIREPCRFDSASRTKNLNDMIYESDIYCVQQLRMDRRCFWNLCSLVKDIGGLRDTRNVKVEEMVAMFLHVLAYDEKSRSMRADYQRSQETISRHFNNVLGAVLKLWRVLLKTPQPIPDNCNEERWKWFKMRKRAETIKLNKRRDKRVWTAEEEKVLTDILYEMNDSGWKVDTGHKSGYLLYIEKELAKRLPNANIKADPNIQSKVKTMKKLLSYILDIQQTGSGFGWDDDRKMVIGVKEQFMGWAKSRPGAAALYMKPFVNYDKLCEIYATDLAKGAKAKGPGDMFEEHSSANFTEATNEVDNCVGSHSQQPSHHNNPSNGSKCTAGRKRMIIEDDVLALDFSSVAKSLKTLVEVETTNASAMNAVRAAFVKEVEAHNQTAERSEQLFSVIAKFDEFSQDQVVKAALMIGQNEATLKLFFTTPDQYKSEFVHQVLHMDK